MKTIDLASGTPSLPALLDLASEENIILRTEEGKEYVLAEIDDLEREVALVRRTKSSWSSSTGVLSRAKPTRSRKHERSWKSIDLGRAKRAATDKPICSERVEFTVQRRYHTFVTWKSEDPWNPSTTATGNCIARTSRRPSWPSGSARRCTSTARRRSWGRSKALQTAFAEVDPLVCYSVKANSNLGILKVMAEHGSGFDVVSAGELYRVGWPGASRTRRCSPGVGKTDEEIQAGLEAGVLMFNVESEAELDADRPRGRRRSARSRRSRCESIPTSTPRPTDTSRPARRSRSSAWTSSGPRGCAEAAVEIPSIRMIGMHMHIGSQITTTEPYAGAVAKGVELIGRLREMGHPIAWYNMGGGYGINYKGREARPIEEFARVIVPGVKAAGLPAGDRAGAGDRRECGHPAQPCVIYQAVGREAVPHPGRRDERPDPACALRVVSPDLAGRRCPPGCRRARGRRVRRRHRRDRALGRRRPGLRERRLPGQGPPPAPARLGATCSPPSPPAPTAWSWRPTTTPVPAPPRSSSMARTPGWSAAARRSRISSATKSASRPWSVVHDGSVLVQRKTERRRLIQSQRQLKAGLLPPNPRLSAEDKLRT